MSSRWTLALSTIHAAASLTSETTMARLAALVQEMNGVCPLQLLRMILSVSVHHPVAMRCFPLHFAIRCSLNHWSG